MSSGVNYRFGVEINPDDLVDAVDVAEMLGLGHRQSVSVYRKRYDDFPEPVFERHQCVLWRRQDVDRWNSGRSRRNRTRAPE